jgi:hypothetical protein
MIQNIFDIFIDFTLYDLKKWQIILNIQQQVKRISIRFAHHTTRKVDSDQQTRLLFLHSGTL